MHLIACKTDDGSMSTKNLVEFLTSYHPSPRSVVEFRPLCMGENQ